MIIKNNSINKTNKIDLRTASLGSKLFFQNYRYFDILTKTNGSLNLSQYYPDNFKISVTLPVIIESGTPLSWLKFILNCLKIIRFFTFQKSFLKKKIDLQQLKKWNSGFVLISSSNKDFSYNWFFYYILTILPYLWISYLNEMGTILSDIRGNISFHLNDISFFANFLDKKHIEWDWQFSFFFSWEKNIKVPNRLIFFKLPFVEGMLKWIFWSSLGLSCVWGHGGWLTFTKFSTVIFHSNKLFFGWNFRF